MRAKILASAVTSVALAYACGGPEADVLRFEATADAAPEAAVDASDGAPSEASSEAATDAGLDANADAELDASADAAADACDGKVLSSDPDHCGACFRSCVGGACFDGGCTPVLLANMAGAVGIALDDERVYFAEAAPDGGVYSVRKDGADRRQLAFGLSSPQRVAVDATFVYFSTVGTPGIVGRVDKAGTNALVLTKTNASPGSLAQDGAEMFFVDLYSASIRKVSTLGMPDAGVAPLFADAGNYPWGLTLAGSDVVWSSRGTFVAGDGGPGTFPLSDGILYAAPRDGSGPRRVVASDQNEPLAVAADATGIYWVTANGRQILKLASGGSAPVVLASDQPSPWGLTLDATHVYFTCFGSAPGKGIVARVRKDGTSPSVEVLASDLAFPSTIAGDEKAVYWTNTHGATVMKIAK